MNDSEGQRNRFVGPGVGLVFGAGLGLLVSVLASLDLALCLAFGAGLGLVAGSIFDQMYTQT